MSRVCCPRLYQTQSNCTLNTTCIITKACLFFYVTRFLRFTRLAVRETPPPSGIDFSPHHGTLSPPAAHHFPQIELKPVV